MTRCYVGDWAARPIGLLIDPSPPGFLIASIEQLPGLVESLAYDIWTNNPLVVDCFPPEQVMVCGFVAGKTMCRPLSDHPGWHLLSDEFTTGEVWTNERGKWLDRVN